MDFYQVRVFRTNNRPLCEGWHWFLQNLGILVKKLHEELVWKISTVGASPLRGAGSWCSHSVPVRHFLAIYHCLELMVPLVFLQYTFMITNKVTPITSEESQDNCQDPVYLYYLGEYTPAPLNNIILSTYIQRPLALLVIRMGSSVLASFFSYAPPHSHLKNMYPLSGWDN